MHASSEAAYQCFCFLPSNVPVNVWSHVTHILFCGHREIETNNLFCCETAGTTLGLVETRKAKVSTLYVCGKKSASAADDVLQLMMQRVDERR